MNVAPSFPGSRVAVLCARADSVYYRFPACEVYDALRNAWTYDGSHAVIAHPPCRLWAGLAHFAKPKDADEERALAIFCAAKVRRLGGILEHPAHSRLWTAADLPLPGCDSSDGFTLDIDQFWFGHPSRKRTWLFISGVSRADLPPLPYALRGPNTCPVEFCSKAQRERTPPLLASWLVEVALLADRSQAPHALRAIQTAFAFAS